MRQSENVTGFCLCGCGQRTTAARVTRSSRGEVAGQPRRFVKGHSPRVGRRQSGYRRVRGSSTAYEHVAIVEAALGKPLPAGAKVHHFNGDTLDNNRHGNLVCCQDQAYHMLLHRRQRALAACGKPNWRPCRYCHRFDDPKNLMGTSPRGYDLYHRACRQADRRAKSKAGARA